MSASQVVSPLERNAKPNSSAPCLRQGSATTTTKTATGEDPPATAASGVVPTGPRTPTSTNVAPAGPEEGAGTISAFHTQFAT